MTKKTPFKRKIFFKPGFDRRHSDPKRNYGIGGVTIYFILTGEKGAVSFCLMTDWYPRPTQDRLMKEYNHGNGYGVTRETIGVQPLGADLSYHSPVPLRDWQEKDGAHECTYVKGGKCYGDGTSLGAEPIRDAFLVEGEHIVWLEMERYYKHNLDSKEPEVGFGDLLNGLANVFGAAANKADKEANNDSGTAQQDKKPS